MQVKADTAGLKKFRDNLAKLSKAQVSEFTEEAVKDLAARLLAKVIKLTPVGKKPDGMKETIEVTGKSGKKKLFLTARAAALQRAWAGYVGGTLRRSWTDGELAKSGSTYSVEVFNPMEYALYVEYGHRGVMVPELKRVLHTDTRWTPGRFMLTISERELQRDAPGILQKKLTAFVKGAFNA